MVSDPPNWFFSLCAFIGFVLCMIPLPWHFEAWNTGTCMYMIWTGLACLNQCINSIVWNADDIDRAPVWCDISSKFMVGSMVAIPAASLCINRRLYHIASISSVTKSRAQKRRDVLGDLAIGVGIPVIEMCLHYIVQTHRFLIYEEIGCYPFIWNTAAAYPLVLCWPLAIGVVSAYYCIRTIRELVIRRAQFKELLSSNKNLSSSRYFRLMGLAGIEMVCTVPLAAYNVYLCTTTDSIQAWMPIPESHAQFSVIEQVPAALWQQDELLNITLTIGRYLVVVCAIVFFGFFGFAEEAKKNYRLAYGSVTKWVGLSTGSISTTGTWTANGTHPDMSYNGGPANMPVFITQHTEKRPQSLASFSTNLSLQDYGGSLADDKKEEFSPTATSSGAMSKETLSASPVDLDAVALPSLPDATLDVYSPPRYMPSSTDAV